MIVRSEQRRMNPRTMRIYYVLLFLSVLALLGSILTMMVPGIIFGTPLVIVTLLIIVRDRDEIHVPPITIFLAVLLIWSSMLGMRVTESEMMDTIVNILSGMVVGLIGLALAYSISNTRIDERRIVAVGFTFGVAADSLLQILVYYLEMAFDIFGGRTAEEVIFATTTAAIGAAIICIIFYIGRRAGAFTHLTEFLERTSRKHEDGVKFLISKGESETLEFKSTLRTNIQTGEKDKRMEKAVMKTLVAFMNSDGGVLLVGVSDDGAVIGVDKDGFENTDKFHLHITNLISSQIGNDFLPFISFGIEDTDGACVLMMKCRSCNSPVFLKDGKSEEFYVRSGPSSVELNGIELINYVKNRGV